MKKCIYRILAIAYRANFAIQALANNTSIRPSFLGTASNHLSRSLNLLTSECTAKMSAPGSLAAASSAFWLRPEISTFASAC